MKSLKTQFDKAILDAFEVHEGILDKMAQQIDKNRRQQAILNTLMSDYRDRTELIQYVLDSLDRGRFEEGMDATEFFCRCADELFIMNLADADRETLPKNIAERMKLLHPLWGECWWTK